jgi:GTP-binding protein HflX
LFATLDPTVRRIVLPGNTTVVVADTVGFIRELPHELVAAFQSTLTEAREATLLLHVVDVSDPRRDEHIDEVNRVLAEIGAADLPQILVFNKTDRIGVAPRVERDETGRASHVWLSAMRSEGLDLLREAVAERLSRVARRATLRLPVWGGELRARLYAADLVLAERIAADGTFEIDTELSEFELLKWAREPGVEILALAGDSTCTTAGAYLQSSPAVRSS